MAPFAIEWAHIVPATWSSVGNGILVAGSVVDQRAARSAPGRRSSASSPFLVVIAFYNRMAALDRRAAVAGRCTSRTGTCASSEIGPRSSAATARAPFSIASSSVGIVLSVIVAFAVASKSVSVGKSTGGAAGGRRAAPGHRGRRPRRGRVRRRRIRASVGAAEPVLAGSGRLPPPVPGSFLATARHDGEREYDDEPASSATSPSRGRRRGASSSAHRGRAFFLCSTRVMRAPSFASPWRPRRGPSCGRSWRTLLRRGGSARPGCPGSERNAASELRAAISASRCSRRWARVESWIGLALVDRCRRRAARSAANSFCCAAHDYRLRGPALFVGDPAPVGGGGVVVGGDVEVADVEEAAIADLDHDVTAGGAIGDLELELVGGDLDGAGPGGRRT